MSVTSNMMCCCVVWRKQCCCVLVWLAWSPLCPAHDLVYSVRPEEGDFWEGGFKPILRETQDLRQVSGRAKGLFPDLFLSRSCIVLAVSLGSLSSWNVYVQPSLSFWELSVRFSGSVTLFFVLSLNHETSPHHFHSLMLPQAFLQERHIKSRPEGSILVSLDQRILFLPVQLGLVLRTFLHVATLP